MGNQNANRPERLANQLKRKGENISFRPGNETSMRLVEDPTVEMVRHFSLMVSQTINAILLTDASGKITWINPAFTDIMGYSMDEVHGRKPGDFLQGQETDPATVDYLRHAIAAGQPFDCKILNYTKWGKKCWIHIIGQPLRDDAGEILQFFSMMTDITEKMIQEKKLIDENLHLQKEITNAVIAAQERQGEAIAGELHDNVNQILGATKLYLEMAKSDPENNRIYLDQAIEYLISTIEEIKHVSNFLSPLKLSVIGLYRYVENLISDFEKTSPVKIEFSARGLEDEEISLEMQLNLFRIVQEQLANIRKHSIATTARIEITREGEKLILVIADNGTGFDMLPRGDCIGLRNIVGRAGLHEGRTEITSRPGEGFQIRIVFPFSFEDHPAQPL